MTFKYRKGVDVESANEAHRQLMELERKLIEKIKKYDKVGEQNENTSDRPRNKENWDDSLGF